MSQEKLFPVHPVNRPEGCPETVLWSGLNEDHAEYFHNQTLDRLASRGGLSIHEVVINVERRRFYDCNDITNEYALSVVRRLQPTTPDKKAD